MVVHAGFNAGLFLLQSSDYHDNMNRKHFNLSCILMRNRSNRSEGLKEILMLQLRGRNLTVYHQKISQSRKINN